MWDYVISRFIPESALDLGSGCGNAAAYFHRRGIKVIAVEGLETNVLSSLFPALKHDLTNGPVVPGLILFTVMKSWNTSKRPS